MKPHHRDQNFGTNFYINASLHVYVDIVTTLWLYL